MERSLRLWASSWEATHCRAWRCPAPPTAAQVQPHPITITITIAIRSRDLELDHPVGSAESTASSPQTKLGKMCHSLICLVSLNSWMLMESWLCYLIPYTQQLSQERLMLLFDITNTKYIKKVCPEEFISFWFWVFWESEKNSKIPQNYSICEPVKNLFNQIIRLGYSMCSHFDN